MNLLRVLFVRFLIWTSGTYVGAPRDSEDDNNNREGVAVAPGER